MTQVIVIGHGHYGTYIKESMTMLLGEPQGFSFIDFLIGEDVETLKNKIRVAVEEHKGKEILLATDILGGSPFNESIMVAIENPDIVVIAGLNLSGYCEMVYKLEEPVRDVAKAAYESMAISVLVYPEDVIK